MNQTNLYNYFLKKNGFSFCNCGKIDSNLKKINSKIKKIEKGHFYLFETKLVYISICKICFDAYFSNDTLVNFDL